MTSFNLDEILNAEPESAARQPKEAQLAARLPDLEQAGAEDVKLLALLKRALKKSAEGDAVAMARLALKALDMNPEHAGANQIMGMAMDQLGRLSHAIDFFERALKRNPTDSGVYYNLGLVAWKLDMLEGAERFYRIALELTPDSDEAAINLAGVLRDQAKFADAIEILRAATYRKPDNHLFWNALGTTLLEYGDAEQAKIFYEETLRLAPDFARGWHNLGHVQSSLGEVEEALASAEKALVNPESEADRAEMIYSRAIARLTNTDLEGGWSDYAVRLDPNYKSGTTFLQRKPMWSCDEPIAGKRLLLLGEQGVGDEVLFISVAPDLIEEIGPEGRLTIACERRLVPLIERSFPDATVIFHGTTNREGRNFRGLPNTEDWGDVDLWCPMASPLIRYRRSLEDFPERHHLAPDPDRVEEFRRALEDLPAGPKVGLCWKSKLMTGRRLKYFSPFEAWKPVLATPGAVFVSLQYGEVDDEVAHAAKDYGVTIHQLPDLDLMNDLDGVAALGAALDLSMGPLNASTNLAAAAGGEVWFTAIKNDWPLLGTNRNPWYPRSRAYSPEQYGDWATVMARMAADLAASEKLRRAA